jgi:hypothetical protein
LSLDKLAQIVEVATIPDRTTALVKLQQLLEQFFPAYQGRGDFDDLAEDILNDIDEMLSRFNEQNILFPG